MNAQDSVSIREKLVVKTVHNVRNLRQKEETAQGMYRKGIKLDLQRSRLLTESGADSYPYGSLHSGLGTHCWQ
jgi:hypothetical protein